MEESAGLTQQGAHNLRTLSGGELDFRARRGRCAKLMLVASRARRTQRSVWPSLTISTYLRSRWARP
eukprot:3835873-Pyramimonas_sp.AAC.1